MSDCPTRQCGDVGSPVEHHPTPGYKPGARTQRPTDSHLWQRQEDSLCAEPGRHRQDRDSVR